MRNKYDSDEYDSYVNEEYDSYIFDMREFFEDSYETMCGLRLGRAAAPWMDNAFQEGELCDVEYEKMRAAYGRICDRLGVQNEDKDLDIMVESMEKIQKELCRRIFYLTRE